MEQTAGKRAWLCVIIAFVAMLLVGLIVFDDYGFSFDEEVQRQHALISYRTVARMLSGREVFSDAGPSLTDYEYKYYGVAMQLPLVFAEDMYQLSTGTPMPMRTVYRMRHLYTFLIYWFALVCFYRMLRRMFDSPWLALAGVCMVYLFGRFFAQSCYNIKDMLFTSLFMIALYCAERVFATKRKPLWCVLFAVSGALLVTSRIVGALLIVLVLAAMLIEDIASARAAGRGETGEAIAQASLWRRLLPYLLICGAYPVWILVTPAAWRDPVGFSLGYVFRFSNYTAWRGFFPFFDRLINIGGADNMRVPRGYLIAWIALTVPIVNQLLCAGGIAGFLAARVRGLVRRERDFGARTTMLTLMLLMLVGTLFYQFAFQPVVYDGWRHAFFLYPVMIAFAVYALSAVWTQARAKKRAWMGVAVSGALMASLVCNAVSIAANHPYEFMSYNAVGRAYAEYLARDYWGVANYNALKWLTEHCDEETILVAGTDSAQYPPETFDAFRSYTDNTELLLATVNSYVFEHDAYLLPAEQSARISICAYPDATYLLQNYTRTPGVNALAPAGYEEIYAIEAYGVKLLSILKRAG